MEFSHPINPTLQKGRYELKKLLGQGGIGEVFLAQEGDRQVALKVLKPSLGSNLRQFFKREARLLSRLSHPNLVKIFDFQEVGAQFSASTSQENLLKSFSPGAPFFSMEYIAGISLDQVPRSSPAETWVNLLAQICHGLHYLHSRHILHRDLKPTNVFLTDDGKIKILDFSLSLNVLDKNLAVQKGGTLAFMPPEAFSGNYEPRSDLFSLGVLFYRILTGKMPFSRPLQAANRSQMPKPPALKGIAPELPDYFCEMVDRMLELNPEMRPNSSLTVLRYLIDHSNFPLPVLEKEEAGSILEKIPLVGRKNEFERLKSAAKNKGNTLSEIVGPTGIGRSRLMEELKWHLLLDQNIPWYSISPQAEFNAKDIIQKIGIKAPDHEEDLDSLTHFFIRSLPPGKICLAFSDFHRWPLAARQEIGFFLDSVLKTQANLCILVEYNSDFLPDWEFRPQSSHEKITLQDLNSEESRSLLQLAVLGSPLPDPVLGDVLQSSGGRPLLLLESLQQALRENDGLKSETKTIRPPQNLQEAMNRRISRLSLSGKKILGILLSSVDPVTLDDLSEIWDQTEGELEDALLELDRANFLAPRGPENTNLSLSHLSFGEIILSELPEKVKTESHSLWIHFLNSRDREAWPRGKLDYFLVGHAIAIQDRRIAQEHGMQALEYVYRQGLSKLIIDLSIKLLDIIQIPLQRCHIFAYQAPAYFTLGEFEKCLQAYELWYQLREDDESQLQKVKYFFYRGLAYFGWGKNEETVHHLKECLKTSDPKKYPSLRPYYARAHNLLAAIFEKSGKWEEARLELQGSLNLELDEPLLQGEVEQRLGKIDLRLLQLKSAKTHFENCLRHFEASKDKKAISIAHNLLSSLYQVQGLLNLAENSARISLELLPKKNDLLQWARNQSKLGVILKEKGNYSQASDLLKNSAEIFKFFGTQEDRAIADLQLATLYLWEGNLDRSNSLLTQIRKKQPSLQEQGLWRSFLLLLAEGSILLEDVNRAEKIFAALLGNSTITDLDCLQAQLGLIRIQCRLGLLDRSDHSFQETLRVLRSVDGLFFSAWASVLSFISQEPESLKQSDFQGTLQGIKNVESLELQLELVELVVLYLTRHQLEGLSGEIRSIRVKTWNKIYSSLNEEVKMDFEKNRGLRELDRIVSEPLETKKKKEIKENKIPPTQESSAPNISGSIPETKFRQFCEIARQISKKGSLGEILERVMDATIELSHAERGFLLLKKDPEGDESPENLEVKTARHLNHRSLKKDEFEFSYNMVRQAMLEGSPVLSENALEDNRFAEMQSVHALQLKSILVIPFEVEGEILGAIYLDNRFRPNCFSPEDVSIISGFAGQAALAIQKGMMMEALRQAKNQLEKKVQAQAERLEVLSEELSHSRKDLKLEYSEMIGKSPAMMRVFQLLDHVTQTKIPVWIWGESGTGKELIARALHFNSNRKQGPFVSENCSSIPETLIESELFGHKKGAFTHADRDRIGLFEQASGGTLFLDEIADMSMNMQAKLLRVLQESEVRPVGSNKKVKIDVRLVTASHRDIEHMVKEGKFRQDLFYRINGMTIALPPLRERREDIPLLVHHLVKKISQEYELKPAEIAPEVLQYLIEQSWPGNIRQLEAVVRNLLLFAHGKPITRETLDLQLKILERPKTVAAQARTELPPARVELDESEVEKRGLIESLIRHNLDKARVADEFSITLKSVYARMDRLGIPTKKSLLVKYLEGHSVSS